MTIKTIDKAAATRISDEIFVALADLPEKLGVDIRPGGGSYSDGNLTLKIIIATRNGDGTVNTPEADSFRQYAHQIGLEPEDLGREFTNNTGDRCSLVGYKPRSRKYPMLYRNHTNGSQYKTTVKAILEYLANEAA